MKLPILKGVVLDAETNMPLIGVGVFLDSYAAVTDREGRFAFSVPAGTYTLKIMFAFYKPYEERIDLYEDREVEIRLIRAFP